MLKACNRIWGNEVVVEYLKTGSFHAWSPFGPDIRFEEPEGRPGCDWFGVNHYARCATSAHLYFCVAADISAQGALYLPRC